MSACPNIGLRLELGILAFSLIALLVISKHPRALAISCTACQSGYLVISDWCSNLIIAACFVRQCSGVCFDGMIAWNCINPCAVVPSGPRSYRGGPSSSAFTIMVVYITNGSYRLHNQPQSRCNAPVDKARDVIRTKSSTGASRRLQYRCIMLDETRVGHTNRCSLTDTRSSCRSFLLCSCQLHLHLHRAGVYVTSARPSSVLNNNTITTLCNLLRVYLWSGSHSK